MTTKKGKVISKEGKYFLEVEGKATAISDKTVSDPAALKSMAGKAVEIEYSDGKSVFPVSIEVPTAGPKVRPKIRITCYLPKIDISSLVMTDALRTNLAAKMATEGIITKSLAEKINVQKIQ